MQLISTPYQLICSDSLRRNHEESCSNLNTTRTFNYSKSVYFALFHSYLTCSIFKWRRASKTIFLLVIGSCVAEPLQERIIALRGAVILGSNNDLSTRGDRLDSMTSSSSSFLISLAKSSCLLRCNVKLLQQLACHFWVHLGTRSLLAPAQQEEHQRLAWIQQNLPGCRHTHQTFFLSLA